MEDVFSLSFKTVEGPTIVETQGKDYNSRDYIDEFELMQFTGLTDADGTEIYEGDIIEFEIYPGGIYCRGVVRYGTYKIPHERRGREGELTLQGPHIVEYGIMRGDEFTESVYHRNWTLPIQPGNGKVIGNIWENGDLLK